MNSDHPDIHFKEKIVTQQPPWMQPQSAPQTTRPTRPTRAAARVQFHWRVSAWFVKTGTNDLHMHEEHVLAPTLTAATALALRVFNSQVAADEHGPVTRGDVYTVEMQRKVWTARTARGLVRSQPQAGEQ